MERQLVTIRTVSELLPIPDADRIELAKIDGWQCVVKKGDFNVNDAALFFEIDSLLPTDDPRFTFLAKGKIQPHARIKTVRLKKQLSQGLLMPLRDFPEVTFNNGEQSLTDLLKVKKYEPTLPMGGKQKGTFPTHLVPKTDQERIQNIPHVLDGRSIADFEVTEKLDGTSCTIWSYVPLACINTSPDLETAKSSAVGVASRNWEMQLDDDNAYSNVVRQNDLVNKLWILGRNIAIQGEIIGPGIQGNKYGLTKQEFFVFDIYDIDAKKYLSYIERMELTFQLELKHVPILIWNASTAMTLDNILGMADGSTMLCRDNVMREGVVFKALDGSFSFKAISNQWLLKHE